MKTETYEVVVDKIGNVFGGWNSGYSVEAHIHHELVGSSPRQCDGYETVRVSLDRDRLVKSDGSNDLNAVADMVRERVGETVTIEFEDAE